LQDARSTLAALREDAATAQVGSEAENLLGIMTDLLADLSGELELVGDHLVTTRDEISASQVRDDVSSAPLRVIPLAPRTILVNSQDPWWKGHVGCKEGCPGA
jgi:hypothetical protein